MTLQNLFWLTLEFNSWRLYPSEKLIRTTLHHRAFSLQSLNAKIAKDGYSPCTLKLRCEVSKIIISTLENLPVESEKQKQEDEILPVGGKPEEYQRLGSRYDTSGTSIVSMSVREQCQLSQSGMCKEVTVRAVRLVAIFI